MTREEQYDNCQLCKFAIVVKCEDATYIGCTCYNYEGRCVDDIEKCPKYYDNIQKNK